MKLDTKRMLLGAVILAVIVVGTVALVNLRSVPTLNVTPVQKNAPTLNEADVEKLLKVEHFRVVRRVRQVPSAVKQSFANFTGLPFDMADPGKPISSDVITSAPLRRLVFAGVSDDSAVLVYEQGGYVGTLNAVVFWYGDGGRAWRAVLDAPADDVPSFLRVIDNRHFHAW
ncbi:MAG: hypothetical protein ACYC92_13045 [Candidatus Acidiferrales bacterium]